MPGVPAQADEAEQPPEALRSVLEPESGVTCAPGWKILRRLITERFDVVTIDTGANGPARFIVVLAACMRPEINSGNQIKIAADICQLIAEQKAIEALGAVIEMLRESAGNGKG